MCVTAIARSLRVAQQVKEDEMEVDEMEVGEMEEGEMEEDDMEEDDMEEDVRKGKRKRASDGWRRQIAYLDVAAKDCRR